MLTSLLKYERCLYIYLLRKLHRQYYIYWNKCDINLNYYICDKQLYLTQEVNERCDVVISFARALHLLLFLLLPVRKVF